LGLRFSAGKHLLQVRAAGKLALPGCELDPLLLQCRQQRVGVAAASLVKRDLLLQVLFRALWEPIFRIRPFSC
jgi:hypothetical protein